jgi:hypothetical protein
MNLPKCIFTTEGLVLRIEENIQIIDREKLRNQDLQSPLISLADEICKRCICQNFCDRENTLVHDGVDWTVGVVSPL